MKTKLSLAAIFCLVLSFSFAQTVPFPTHTVNDNTVPFSEKMDDVFGNLNLSNVTTNLLLDRAWPFAKPADFDDEIFAKKRTLNITLINVNRKITTFSLNSNS